MHLEAKGSTGIEHGAEVLCMTSEIDCLAICCRFGPWSVLLHVPLLFVFRHRFQMAAYAALGKTDGFRWYQMQSRRSEKPSTNGSRLPLPGRGRNP